MGLKIVWEKPEIHEDVKNLMKKESGRKKKPDLPIEWKTKDRMIVGILLIISVLGTAYIWYKGQGQSFGTFWENASLPRVEFKTPDFGETIILEK